MIEQLNGLHETVNYAKNMQMRLFNNSTTENYPPHWHTPFELIMPTEGIYTVQCESETYILNPGDIIVICPGSIHQLYAPEKGTRIIFQPSLSNIHIQDLDLITTSVHPAIVITPETEPVIHENIYRLMLEIRDEYLSATAYSELTIFIRFLDIMSLIGRKRSSTGGSSSVSTSPRQKEYLEKVYSICNYINDHFAEDLSLDDIAFRAGFSKYHFTRLFRQYAGTTFYKYLSQKRISYAKELLVTHSLSILEISCQSGFASPTAFSRMFRQMTGYTPTEFRAMYDRSNGGAMFQEDAEAGEEDF